jgi:oligopeptidase B
MNKWTSRERLCIEGGSAGGMTVGASLNIEPSLWRVAIMDVPFVDCVATMLDESIPLTVIEFDGAVCIPVQARCALLCSKSIIHSNVFAEWGNPKESKEMFDYMLSYSPMNNIKQGAKYPAMMVTSGLHDPRVQYWEPLKYVQKVRELASRDDPARPVVHRVQMSAGHSSVSGRFQALNEEAVKFAFALHQLGFKLAEFA